jgi:hypothetical protein
VGGSGGGGGSDFDQINVLGNTMLITGSWSVPSIERNKRDVFFYRRYFTIKLNTALDFSRKHESVTFAWLIEWKEARTGSKTFTHDIQ